MQNNTGKENMTIALMCIAVCACKYVLLLNLTFEVCQFCLLICFSRFLFKTVIGGLNFSFMNHHV